MRYGLQIVLVYLLLALESSLLLYLEIPFHAPDLGALVALYMGLTTPFVPALGVVVVTGFLQDAFAMGAPLGLHGASFLLLFLLAYSVSGKVSVRSGVPVMALGLIAAGLSQLLLFTFTAVFDQHVSSYGLLLGGWFPNALITAPFAPGVFFLMDRASRFRERSSRDRVFFR